jgi:hypothetical protein
LLFMLCWASPNSPPPHQKKKQNSVRALEALCDLVAGSETVRDAIDSALQASGKGKKQQQQQQQQQQDNAARQRRSDDSAPAPPAMADVRAWNPLGVDAAGRAFYWLDAPPPTSANDTAEGLVTSRLYRCCCVNWFVVCVAYNFDVVR